MEKQRINNMALEYIKTKSDEVFSEMYVELRKKITKENNVRLQSIKDLDQSEVLEQFDEAVMNGVKMLARNPNDDIVKYVQGSMNKTKAYLLRKTKTRRKRELYEQQLEDDVSFEHIANIGNTKDTTFASIVNKKEDDQRQLIDFLLSGADAKTTAIVEAFLESDKPTPTAIGEKLGLHHSTVIRALKRLAGKFDANRFGDYRDYLVAQ
ncbi:sigma-70 family RNA polymerase sigma factor [Fictibacillus sp. Mic-4]|uniref:sigma-70 family RNA polymerase sigma factor n=1 Tax=Fictibacillus sp. Mic-4 TaxID=3132826 RepID=UPI003CE9670F